jgi:hypothetical protein
MRLFHGQFSFRGRRAPDATACRPALLALGKQIRSVKLLRMIASIVIGATSAVDCRLCGASLSNQQILAYKLRRYIF